MDLLLLRHADAVPQAESDRARALSPKGHAQAARVASFLSTYKVLPNLVLCSPAVRTLETAAPVAEALGREMLPCPWALPGMDPETAVHALAEYRNFSCILLVGHQPDLSLLAARFLEMPNPLRLTVKKASIIHLHLRSAHSASLEALIPCNRT